MRTDSPEGNLAVLGKHRGYDVDYNVPDTFVSTYLIDIASLQFCFVCCRRIYEDVLRLPSHNLRVFVSVS